MLVSSILLPILKTQTYILKYSSLSLHFITTNFMCPEVCLPSFHLNWGYSGRHDMTQGLGIDADLGVRTSAPPSSARSTFMRVCVAQAGQGTPT